VVGVDPGPQGSVVLMLSGTGSELGHASVAQVRAWQAAAAAGSAAGARDVAEAALTLTELSHSLTHSGGRLEQLRGGSG
jgi:hypothetical protein